MNRMMVKSKIGDDGVLHLDLAIGAQEANKEVRITLEPSWPVLTQEEWQAHILSTAASITDPTFEHPPQLLLEDREPLL